MEFLLNASKKKKSPPKKPAKTKKIEKSKAPAAKSVAKGKVAAKTQPKPANSPKKVGKPAVAKLPATPLTKKGKTATEKTKVPQLSSTKKVVAKAVASPKKTPASPKASPPKNVKSAATPKLAHSKPALSAAKPPIAKPISKPAVPVAAAKPANNGKAAPVAQKVAAKQPPHDPVPPPSNTKPEIVAKIRSAQAGKELRKDLAQPAPKTSLTLLTPIPVVEKGKDRLILMVRDPYWIHAHWDIMRHSVDRAKAALAENWHTVKPILRLLKLDDSGTTNNAEVIHKDIEIHGGVRNWYIDVDHPPSRFKMLMGYLCSNGRFYELARSNIVSTPAPGGKEATDDHWADVATDAEHIYSMSGGYGDDTQTGDLTEVFEENLKRTMDADVLSQFGSGAEGSLKRHKQFHFDVNAELIVFGSTHPDAHVSVGTEPVKVRTDGSFSIRLPLPDRRQVLPATAKSRDGVDEQTVVIAVERNTKVMEPLSSDTDDL